MVKELKLILLTPLEGRATWLRLVSRSAGSQFIQPVHLLCERKKGRNTCLTSRVGEDLQGKVINFISLIDVHELLLPSKSIF